MEREFCGKAVLAPAALLIKLDNLILQCVRDGRTGTRSNMDFHVVRIYARMVLARKQDISFFLPIVGKPKIRNLSVLAFPKGNGPPPTIVLPFPDPAPIFVNFRH
jgi:hypothetical protein